MATRFSVPASPSRNVTEIDNFLGVDLTNTGSNVSETRSPNAPNIIRDVPGKVRKRMGYQTITTPFQGKGVIYGAHNMKNTMSTSIMGKNLCSGRSLSYNKLKQWQPAYIYCNECCLPAGSTVHIQFSYKTTGVVYFSPYYETMQYTALNSINTKSKFSKNYTLTEATNAFIILNNATADVQIEITDIMIYFVKNNESYNPNYISYSEINEMSLYTLANSYTISNQTRTVSGTSQTAALSLSPPTILGLMGLSFDLNVNFTSGSMKKITVKYSCYRNKHGVYSPEAAFGTAETVFTSQSSSGYHIFAVIDPAINHSVYDINNSQVAQIYVTVEGTTGTYTATVTASDIKIDTLNLKTNFESNDSIRLIHVSNEMWLEVGGTFIRKLSTKMASNRSASWQNEKKLYVIDGENYYVYNHEDYSFKNIANEIPYTYDNSANVAYVPTLTIAKSPSGGGVSYEDLNLLTPAFIELFEGTATDTTFQLSFSGLDATQVKVWILTNSSWVEKREGTDFSVNRVTGQVIFSTAPGASEIAGEDNVKILAYRTNEGYAEMIKGCRFGTLFGVNGAADRLFLSGNPNYLNRDWHSGQYQYNYFADTSYSKLGSDSSAIMGYSIVNNYLATHKDENDPKQAVIIRSGNLEVTSETMSTDGTTTIYNSEPSFKIINTLQGAGAIAPYSFANLQTEPVFLTRSGIMAITPQDVTGEKYSQNRSFYLDGQLLNESDLSDSVALSFNDMYMLFVNSKVYILDGLQASVTDKSKPYSSRQYAAFLLTDIPAYVAWIEDNELWFGTTDGRICKVYTDKEALESYNDDGNAIYCCWETADMDGKLFYKNKTFRYMAVRLKSNIYSMVNIYSQTRGIWTLIKRSKRLSNRVFQFSTIQFSNFTFNNDTSDPVVSTKLRVKKTDKARFKLENGNLNEPFGIQNLAFEYVESGNFKG